MAEQHQRNTLPIQENSGSSEHTEQRGIKRAHGSSDDNNVSKNKTTKNAGYRGRHFMAVIPGDKINETKKSLEETATYYIGQQERGPTGFHHLQLVFGFPYQKTLSTVTKMLDITSVQYVKDVRKSIMYCTKPETRIGDIIEFGDIPSSDIGAHNRIVLEASCKGTFEEAMEYIESQDLMFYLSHKKTIGPWLAAKFSDEDDKPIYKMESFIRKPIRDFTKTVVIVGPTGMGKTQYSLAHFEHPLLVRDKNDYARYSRKTDGIVFDDLAFVSWNPMTFLHMVENETPITQDVKFGHVRIRARIPKIICVNSTELLWPKDIMKETKDACLRRMVIFYVQTPLFKKVSYKSITTEPSGFLRIFLLSGSDSRE
uniref:Replication-associated protein n=1 Tax=Giant panda associated circular DNA virus TaxID=2863990 RepID=A0A8K1M595_9VIRU|nr:replication-associated protein [Giant panda associated circular DNA virus]